MNDGSTPTHKALKALARGESAVWCRPEITDAPRPSRIISEDTLSNARSRFASFEPILARMFVDDAWDGRICSELLSFPAEEENGVWLVKGDHALPMTGSIKARGGVHELMVFLEGIATEHAMSLEDLLAPSGQAVLADHRVVVASTGNLGYSIGLVGSAFGLRVDVHMSADAKHWKKERLRAAGATVIEHAGDYSEAVARARSAALIQNAYFVDDERSVELFTGYAAAADEVAVQLEERGIAISAQQPLVVYLPCGVGGAPGGIGWGLKRLYGNNVALIFVEPVAAPCMLVALASGGIATSVYEIGCTNVTVADGLAVPRASELVLEAVGEAIDAAVAVSDSDMVMWVRHAWESAGLRLEPSAAAAFAAYDKFWSASSEGAGWPDKRRAIHLFWATGGSRLPDEDFAALLRGEA